MENSIAASVRQTKSNKVQHAERERDQRRDDGIPAAAPRQLLFALRDQDFVSRHHTEFASDAFEQPTLRPPMISGRRGEKVLQHLCGTPQWIRSTAHPKTRERSLFVARQRLYGDGFC